MSEDPAAATRVVEDGYDRVALRYAELEGKESWPRMRWVRRVVSELPDGAAVLDLGCGAGVPVGSEVVKRRRFTGVDISRAQIELARVNVPEAEFFHADLTKVELPEASFDAAFSFYAIDHVPREQHAALFRSIRRWLRPRGVLLISVEAGDEPSATGEWLGAPMYFSHFDEETTTALVEAAGFTVVETAVEEQWEGDHAVPYLWLLATA